VVNRAYKLFPEGSNGDATKKPSDRETAEQRAFTRATRGVHW
jgi:hypothetical protein